MNCDVLGHLQRPASVLFALMLLLLPSCKGANAPESSKPAAVSIDKEYERGPVRVRLMVDKDNVTIAENLTMTLESDVKEGYEAQLPAFGDKLGQFGIVDYREEPAKLTDEGRILTRKVYELEPFLSGEYKIAPMKITFRTEPSPDNVTRDSETHELETEEVTIKVSSLLGEDRNKLQINPIFGPVDLPAQPMPRARLFIGIALLSVIGGVAFFFWHKYRRQESEAVLRISAHELAYRQIQEILDENFLDRGEIKRFYAGISDVVRHYIENRFGLHAPKCTTEEFLLRIGVNGLFRPDHQTLLDEFLRHCDLVKFAEHQPSAEEIQKTFNACKAFIEATKKEESTDGVQSVDGVEQ